METPESTLDVSASAICRLCGAGVGATDEWCPRCMAPRSAAIAPAKSSLRTATEFTPGADGRLYPVIEREAIAKMKIGDHREIVLRRSAMGENIGPFGRVSFSTSWALLALGIFLMMIGQDLLGYFALGSGFFLTLLVLNRVLHPEQFQDKTKAQSVDGAWEAEEGDAAIEAWESLTEAHILTQSSPALPGETLQDLAARQSFSISAALGRSDELDLPSGTTNTTPS